MASNHKLMVDLDRLDAVALNELEGYPPKRPIRPNEIRAVVRRCRDAETRLAEAERLLRDAPVPHEKPEQGGDPEWLADWKRRRSAFLGREEADG